MSRLTSRRLFSRAPRTSMAPQSPARPQPAAFFTSSAIRFSTAGVSSITANSVGHMSPSSRLRVGLEAEGRVADLELRLGLEEADRPCRPCPPWRRPACRSTSSGTSDGTAAVTMLVDPLRHGPVVGRHLGDAVAEVLQRPRRARRAGLALRRRPSARGRSPASRPALRRSRRCVVAGRVLVLRRLLGGHVECSFVGRCAQAVAFWAALPCWRIRIGLPNGSRRPMSVP